MTRKDGAMMTRDRSGYRPQGSHEYHVRSMSFSHDVCKPCADVYSAGGGGGRDRFSGRQCRVVDAVLVPRK
jgi:hypothetical protein